MDAFFDDLLFVSLLVYALFIGGVGIYLLIIAWCHKKWEEGCRSWVKTKGIVIANDVIIDNDLQGRMRYSPMVQYNFQAKRHFYQGGRMRLGEPLQFRRQSSAKKVLADFSLGSKVNVLYNPANPEDAVLARDDYIPSHCVLIGMFLIMLAILLLSAIYSGWLF